MPKKKESPLSAAEQRRRFEVLAREAGASTSGKDLREAVKRVAKPRDAKAKRDRA